MDAPPTATAWIPYPFYCPWVSPFATFQFGSVPQRHVLPNADETSDLLPFTLSPLGTISLGTNVDRHLVTSPGSSEARRKRRKKLDQKAFAREGPSNLNGANARCGQFDEDYVQALKVTYPDRSYYGPPQHVCPHCHATFWLREALGQGSTRRDGQPIYNSCCKGGKVVIQPFLPRPEPLASLARFDGDAVCNKFMKNIRQYNCLFAFTSMGANIDRTLNDGRGPPVFKISGQIHHRIGSLLPHQGARPKFIQLYIYDTTNEVQNRIRALDKSEPTHGNLDPEIVQSLMVMLDRHNPFAKQFRAAKERLHEHGDEEFAIRIIAPSEGDPPQYSLPTTEELAMLVVGDFSVDAFQRDIIVQSHSGQLQQISSLHPAFMPLQYPLLFPFGERGYQTGVVYEGMASAPQNSRAKMTMQDYFRYMLHYKGNQPNPYLCYGTLSSQIKVDARACIDESRLFYILDNQRDIRMESIQGITDAVNRGGVRGKEMGKVTVLPASFTGGRRYMMQNYHDSIAICRDYGPPDFFVTFTCNPKWPDIAEGITEAGQRPTDRSDIIVRVFNMKLEELLHDLRYGKVFGKCTAVLHTVEFQKRGLPHAHIILWTKADTTEPSPSLIDSHISAEIPDPATDPLGYALVAEHMMHGPCGSLNPACPCMKNGKCSKFYPKQYHEETSIDQNGFCVYKRRQNDLYIEKGGHRLDNRWVVPHNLLLLKKYQAHINVEWCNKTIFVKYLFKYVTKGADSSKAYIKRVRNGDEAPYDQETNTINEIKEYLDCRYICEQDACWRIFGYDIHRHYPAVERMTVHLPNENFISFKAAAKMKTVLEQEFLRKTMLTEWFTANQTYSTARNLTYAEFPTKWTWEPKTRTWEPRRDRKRKIGRMHYVHPTAGERYYLRLLLLSVKGAVSYQDLRSYNGTQYSTYKQACKARGLIGDDQEWYDAFAEATRWATSAHLRQLFVTMIMFCEVSDECAFFERVWKFMGDDLQYQVRATLMDINYSMSDIDLRDAVISALSEIFSNNGRDITEFKLPRRSIPDFYMSYNPLIMQELSYSVDERLTDDNILASLNPDQLRAFHAIVDTVMSGESGFFFVSGYGGTGKTYLWNCICNYLRSRRKIVLTVASSGVASLLLPGGRTAHSRFGIPCELEDDTICNVSKGTMAAELIQSASLIIWDEALMTNRKGLEALDRTLKDIETTEDFDASTELFGGKVVVLGGDVRQILPVVEGGSRAQIINAAIFNSHLWFHVKLICLTENMRLKSATNDHHEQEEIAAFNRWILDIGEGRVNATARDGETEPSWIKIPADLILHAPACRLHCIVHATYPDFLLRHVDETYLKERAILTPTNESAELVNDYMVSMLPENAKEYLSNDSISKATSGHESYDLLYPVEFLNSLNGNNFPQHMISLKKGVPIMLLRNLNQKEGLCNGSRLIVTQLGERIIEARLITGNRAGTDVYIPRITLNLKSNKYPFELARRQFPIKVCYAMTINKSQGQTLDYVGVYLKRPVFSHGQLYVAFSRVTSRKGLKVLAEDDQGHCMDETRNVVYPEVLAAFAAGQQI